MMITPLLSQIRRSLCVAGLCLSASAAFAAGQGTVDTTSTGTVDMTLTTGLSARLSGLSDIALGTWGGSGDLNANQNICIGRTGVGFFANGAYRIRASGDGDVTDVSAFTLSNGVQQLYYDVFFNDQTGLTGRTALTGGVMLSAQQGLGIWEIFNTLFGCVARNANVSISVPQAQLESAAGGVYTGTLTLVLIPD